MDIAESQQTNNSYEVSSEKKVSTMEEEKQETPESDNELLLQLSGRTLRVYWYMLNHQKPLGVREIQRGTKLSSASLSAYHLRKLQSMGLVEIDSDGQYSIIEVVRVGVTRFYVKIRNSMIPRFALYASFYAGVIFFMVILISEIPSHIMVFLFVILLFGLMTSVLETLMIHENAPT
jgi:hypothetical protein